MADTVRYLMESMVPELEALHERGYFSQPEIRQIVQRRQGFEYALKRKAAVKADFLRYIEYEQALEELRDARRRQRGIGGPNTLADYCLPRRIHFIYDRLLRKFKGDLALWASWLRYCQATGAARQASRVLTRALRLHPTAPGMWAAAAAWEFEQGAGAAAARALMQQGLRMCGHVPGLWLEYLRMELLYAQRLRERRRVLGIMEAEAALGAEPDGKAGAADASAVAVAAVLDGAVVRVVLKSAMEAVPGSLPFRSKFLEILVPFDFPGKAALEDFIYASIEADFGGSPEGWNLRARRLAPAAPAPLPALHAAAAVYQQGLAALLPGGEVCQLYRRFLTEQLQAAVAGAAAVGTSHKAGKAGRAEAAAAAEARQFLLHELERVSSEACRRHAEGVADEVRLRLHLGDLPGALASAQQAAEVAPGPPEACLQRLRMEAAALALQCLRPGGIGLGGSEAMQRHCGDSSSGSSSDDDDEEHEAAATAAGGSAGPFSGQQQLDSLRSLASQAGGLAGARTLDALALLAATGGALGPVQRQLEQAAAAAPGAAAASELVTAVTAAVKAAAALGGPVAGRRAYEPLLRLSVTAEAVADAAQQLEQVWAADSNHASPPRQLLALLKAAACGSG